ncbi:MAG: hypothetical protein ACTHLA_04870 [Asticcacaulis sp.]|uniref:hypothetical protein n=1 Tax=Asticcacaulis sp. TaxID=1872648 RepID=UPI003F7C8BF8
MSGIRRLFDKIEKYAIDYIGTSLSAADKERIAFEIELIQDDLETRYVAAYNAAPEGSDPLGPSDFPGQLEAFVDSVKEAIGIEEQSSTDTTHLLRKVSHFKYKSLGIFEMLDTRFI